MSLSCQSDPRRDLVRATPGRNGLDYVETGDADSPNVLTATFLGKLPPELAVKRPGLARFLQVSGGERITGLRIVDVDPRPQADPQRDDVLVITLDRAGDDSAYTLGLVNVAGIDPRYDQAAFRFGLCCPSDIDCAPACGCVAPAPDEPAINYLAKDFASFRALILDRLAQLMPDWTEQHLPDLGITLVELLAYVGDQLSYYQDAVGTEAYLGTARQRISVRRHARLVDYAMHEGCNARAWVQVQVGSDLQLPASDVAFATGAAQPGIAPASVVSAQALAEEPVGSFEFFEALPADPGGTLALRAAHNAIAFYTWGGRSCCLDAGATCATLLDDWVVAADGSLGRALAIAPGDVLVFEEILGPHTGVPADADPSHRWAVRVTAVEAGVDTLYPVTVGGAEAAGSQPTPLLTITWAAQDALPFALCLSCIGSAPACAWLSPVSVARGNIVLVDHGRTQPPEALPPVPVATGSACCECVGEPSDVTLAPGRYRPRLAQSPVVHAVPLPTPPAPAVAALVQAPRQALPDVQLASSDGTAWSSRYDLLACGPADACFVLETDNQGLAHLRFGDGRLGLQPAAGLDFTATYRTGGGTPGNVGAEAISRLVLTNLTIDGSSIVVRNPLPAQGGIDPETLDDVKLLAPGAFRQQLERAITAADYAQIADQIAALQGAAARLTWTGSWYEADVAIDPLGTESAAPALLHAVAAKLFPCRRMGHDLRVQGASYVPLKLALQVCALPGYDSGHVEAALLQRLGTGAATPSRPAGFFNPDQLVFGQGVRLSQIIAAAQAVTGVECVTVTAFHRLFEPPNHEIENGLLPLATQEIAQLDNDPDHPERGLLVVTVGGGR